MSGTTKRTLDEMKRLRADNVRLAEDSGRRIGELEAKVANVAAFLDGLADRLDNKGSKPEGFYVPAQDRTLRQAAADCRAWAERLRK
jgi:hypothetical protein